ncbi:MAG TPA: DUF4390 domain-containing protein [Thermoanaerobaculia bacterium]|nr:DUF4390 domain-containing protein [Thermoanaerobaculia bacterium]
MRRLILVSLLLTLTVATVFGAPGPRIGSLTAVATGSHLEVRFSLDGPFQLADLNVALQSGLPTGFTYHVELTRSRPNWLDEHVAAARIDVICTYNSVTHEYLLNYRRNRRLVRSEILTDLAVLRQRMTMVDEPELFDIGKRRPYKLHVRVKADLMRDFLLGVIPWDDSTPWRDTRVTSAGPSQ